MGNEQSSRVYGFRELAPSVSRRHFLTTGAAGAGAAALVGTSAQDAEANTIKWDRTVDVVVIGAGVAGLPAGIAARDHGASVIIVDENYDIGGRGMLSGGRLHLGGGNAMQRRHGIEDSADKVFEDWVRHDHGSQPLQRPRPRAHLRRRERRHP